MVKVKRVLPVTITFILAMMIFFIGGWNCLLKFEKKVIVSFEEEPVMQHSLLNLEVSFEDLLKGPYGMPNDNLMLIKHIQESLIPPSDKPLKLKFPDKDPSKGQTQEIINILGDMRNKGFFVEAGAFNGEAASNTLTLENKYGWKGLLVEANPTLFDDLLGKQRKAWSINCCLSLNGYPNRVMFRTVGVWGKIVDKPLTLETDDEYAQIQCFPIYSILLALKTPTIDFFSLDVEGFELDVLKTIPWDKVNIRTLSVEFMNINTGKHIIGNYYERNASNIIAGREALGAYMESVGYNIYTEAGALNNWAKLRSDFIFYRKDVIPLKPSNYTAQ